MRIITSRNSDNYYSSDFYFQQIWVEKLENSKDIKNGKF
jgi:hypothetical protein